MAAETLFNLFRFSDIFRTNAGCCCYVSHSVSDTKAIFGHLWWNKKCCYWVYFKFEKYQWVEESSLETDRFSLQRNVLYRKRLNNYVAFNFKGTQIHASTADDWLIKALFALSGIPIALSQVIEKGKKVFVRVIPTKEPTQLKACCWKEHRSLLFFHLKLILPNTDILIMHSN